MRIFDRDTPAPADLFDLYGRVARTGGIWHPETFVEAARACGLRRIARRARHFSFSSTGHTSGQAPIEGRFVEELRLFIGQAPRQIGLEEFAGERRNISVLAAAYSDMFRSRLGPSRRANDNDIFEYDNHRVRVFAAAYGPVWVVISNRDIIRQLPNDWWGEAAPP